MRIAVTYESGEIFQHFGHTSQFKVYTAENGKVVASEIIDTHGSGHSALAALLAQQEIDALICGGIGGCARTALNEAGIRLYGGVSGDVDDAVADLLAGQLDFDPCAQCSHHGETHSCGGHCH